MQRRISLNWRPVEAWGAETGQLDLGSGRERGGTTYRVLERQADRLLRIKYIHGTDGKRNALVESVRKSGKCQRKPRQVTRGLLSGRTGSTHLLVEVGEILLVEHVVELGDLTGGVCARMEERESGQAESRK